MTALVQKLTQRHFDFPVIETHVKRANAPRARFSLIDRMFVERGDKSDWDLLHDLHYKAERLPLGPKFWKLTIDGETIGVLVTSVPKGLLKERHAVMPRLKPGAGETKITNTQRYRLINARFRVISRFVVDTMYRGIGCGYRMMNLVPRMEGVPIMEIQSSMSKFNYFGQRAGFRFAKPSHSNKFETGLKFFRSHFDASPQDFEAIVQELNSKPERERQALLRKCQVFYQTNSALENTGKNREDAQKRCAAMSVREVIKEIQQMSLASPLYGVFRNPDLGRDIPQRIPLSWFDNQAPSEPMRIPNEVKA